MKNKLLQIIVNILPPIFLKFMQRVVKRSGATQFKGNYKTWADALKDASGYDDNKILKEVLSATLKVKNGERAFERDSVLFDAIQYSWPVTAGLMRAAALQGGSLNVIDFGGALGSGYFQNREFLAGLKEVKWSVIEQSHFVRAGRDYISNTQLMFYDSIAESLNDSDSCPNVVLLSSVLQYLPDPWPIFEQLLCIGAELMIIDRTPFVARGCSELIKLQIVPSSIYEARYPLHYFVKADLIAKASKFGYRVISDFDSLDRMGSDAPWQGLLLCKGS
jgi:putative methyltransferase (TIGR04325 family)